ncbi:hypothetical protein L6452_02177 [Arctium lappa]|uniref:Uncharacterized protein n=1 Tax=Arctium lappa TaxID=4217 RepID=A0ACB9FJN7_ARCLA|nr:hypothetical protein L6452_02177 [Arctium lappa]
MRFVNTYEQLCILYVIRKPSSSSPSQLEGKKGAVQRRHIIGRHRKVSIFGYISRVWKRDCNFDWHIVEFCCN